MKAFEVIINALYFVFFQSSELIIRLIPALTSSSMEREYTDVLTLMTNLLQKMSKGFYLVPHCSAKLWEFFSGKFTL